jgi:3-(3-hydroxy-phenyl)propionate hydroxylase
LRAADYDVVIIGYGPVGAILANRLGTAGRSVLVLDQMSDIYDKPRAINIDHEVMRVLQRVGLADAVEATTIAYAGTDFLGMDGRPIRVFEPSSPPYPLHWAPNLLFIQPEFERMLRSGVERFANVETRLEHKALSVWDNPGVAGVRFIDSSGETREATARYVVACDGGASMVRRQLGISQESLNFDEWWTVVDAWVKRDTPLPRRTTQFCWPSGPTTYVVGPRNLRRWELKLMPGEEPQDYENREALLRRLAPFVDTDAIEIWRAATYRFHALVADEWRRGRIFLAGDAAHQTPPFMAQGLCSGVRDVANLSWKLIGALSGRLPETVLSTYEVERKPHIRELVSVTKALGEVIGELDVEAAQNRDRDLGEALRAGKTVTVRQQLIPNLTAGILARDDDGRPTRGSGGLFPQPRVRLADGRSLLLDDLVGERFFVVLWGREARAWLVGTSADALARLGGIAFVLVADEPERHAPSDAQEFEDEVGVLADWMRANGYRAVLVRPDKYIFGVADSREALTQLCTQLAAQVFPEDDTNSGPRDNVPAPLRNTAKTGVGR